MLGGSFSCPQPCWVECGGSHTVPVALGTAVVTGLYASVLPRGDGQMAFDCSVLLPQPAVKHSYPQLPERS